MNRFVFAAVALLLVTGTMVQGYSSRFSDNYNGHSDFSIMQTSNSALEGCQASIRIIENLIKKLLIPEQKARVMDEQRQMEKEQLLSRVESLWTQLLMEKS